MGKIVTIRITDATKAGIQKGFKSGLILDTTTDLTLSSKNYGIIEDVSGLATGGELAKFAGLFFSNGGSTIGVAGKDCSTADEVTTLLNSLLADLDFYCITAIVPKASQKEYYTAIDAFASANDKLAILEVNGSAAEVASAISTISTDQTAFYANSEDAQSGMVAGVLGKNMNAEPGSITWGNTEIQGIVDSGYSLADEKTLMAANVNYITKVDGRIVTQMGRTSSGSNIDVTRSKAHMSARIQEGISTAIINNTKIPYTTDGEAIFLSVFNTVGNEEISSGMIYKYEPIVPSFEDAPLADKAKRVIRGLKFVGYLSGSIETVEIELEVTL